MRVNGISNSTSFGRLKIIIDKDLLIFAPIKKEFNQIRKIFKENGFSRKKNVDVLLDYDMNNRSFIGIIESKKQGIPNHPDYKHKISPNKRDVKYFGEWLKTWDYMYSHKGLKEWENFKKRVAQIIESSVI